MNPALCPWSRCLTLRKDETAGRLVLIIGVAQACRPGWAGQIQFPLSSDKQTYLEEPGQELTAAFLPQKPVYLLGEPIWFIFEVKNLGNLPVYIEHAARPYGYGAMMRVTPSTARAQ